MATKSLKQLAIQGVIWTFANYGASQVLRFANNLILTRLLFPEAFGLMALIYTFTAGLQLFTDTGVGPSIIQNKRGDDPDFLNTAWTIQVVRGVGLWLISLTLAWPIAQIYDERQFLWIFPFTALTALIGGFESTAQFTLSRHMEVRKLTIFELGEQVVATIIMIVWASLHKSIWALAGSTVVVAVIRVIWSHLIIPDFNHRFAWSKEAAQELFSFGRWVMISTALTFLASQADRLLLGTMSLTFLGVYGVAFALADMPRQVMLALADNVVFPIISKLADLPRAELRQKIIDKRKLMLLLAAGILVIPVALGDVFITVLYDDRYASAAWIMPVLAIGLWHTLLYSTMKRCLLGVGKPLYEALGNFLTCITIFTALPLGNRLFGPPGAVIAIAISDIPFYLATQYGLWREGMTCVRQDIWTTCVFWGLLALVLWGRYSLGFGSPFDGLLQAI